MTTTSPFAPAPAMTGTASAPGESPTDLLNGLCHRHLTEHPDDVYLAEHATPQAVARHVCVFEWYRRFVPPAGEVLDWGCNHAPDSCLLRAAFGDALRLHGCDFRPAEQYRAFHESCGLSYTRLTDVVELPYPGQAFDVVIGSGTLEHVAMDYESLKQLNRILKVDGVLILSYLPNRWSLHEWRRRVMGRDHHRRLYGLGEAKQLLKRAGFYPFEAGYQGMAYRRRAARLLAWVVPVHVFGSTLCLAARKVHSM
jgi:SAM-dependent methyltransferase